MKRIVLYDASAIERPTREDLHRLARLRLEARRGGCDLVLTGVGQRLRLLLAVTGLDEVFTVSPDMTSGLDACAEPVADVEEDAELPEFAANAEGDDSAEPGTRTG